MIDDGGRSPCGSQQTDSQCIKQVSVPDFRTRYLLKSLINIALGATDSTLNRKCIMSPSWTTYSLPSVASLPAALTALSLPRVTQAKSLYLMTSALKKPFSKSVWKTPYGLRALSPRLRNM